MKKLLTAAMLAAALPLAMTTAAPAAMAEEKRLFYVGITRAKDTLTISWNAQKPASEFLDIK